MFDLAEHPSPTDWLESLADNWAWVCCILLFCPTCSFTRPPSCIYHRQGQEFPHIFQHLPPDYSVTNWTHLSVYSSSTAEEVHGVFLTHFPRQFLLTKFCYRPTISSYCLSYFLGSDFICSPLSRSDASVQEYTHPLNSFSEVSEHALDLRKPELLYVAQHWNLFLYY